MRKKFQIQLKTRIRGYKCKAVRGYKGKYISQNICYVAQRASKKKKKER